MQNNVATIDKYYSLRPQRSAEPGHPRVRSVDDNATVTPVLPELTITKKASGPLAYIDQPFTWTMEISNNSQATAYNFGVKDTMPTNWVYMAGSSTLGGSPIADPTPSGLNLTWAGLGNLSKGQKASLQYQAKPTSAVVIDPGVGLDRATSTSTRRARTGIKDRVDRAGPPRRARPAEDFTEIASADLMLEKTHRTDYPPAWNVAKDEVVPGTEFEWVLKATNNGPDTSIGPFTVKDTLPDGVKYKGTTTALTGPATQSRRWSPAPTPGRLWPRTRVCRISF